MIFIFAPEMPPHPNWDWIPKYLALDSGFFGQRELPFHEDVCRATLSTEVGILGRLWIYFVNKGPKPIPGRKDEPGLRISSTILFSCVSKHTIKIAWPVDNRSPSLALNSVQTFGLHSAEHGPMLYRMENYPKIIDTCRATTPLLMSC